MNCRDCKHCMGLGGGIFYCKYKLEMLIALDCCENLEQREVA